MNEYQDLLAQEHVRVDRSHHGNIYEAHAPYFKTIL
jgi:hypothetical protein